MEPSESDSVKLTDRNTNEGVGEGVKTPQRSRNWLFVINNYDQDSIDSVLELSKKCEKLVMQEEKGKKEGTPHLQGGCIFKSQRTFSQVKQLLPQGAHIEKAKNIHAVLTYSEKEDTKNGKVWKIGFKDEIKDIIKEEGALEWQKQVIEMCKEEPDDRTINWIWERTGCVGKTKLCKHLCLEHEAILVGGAAKDVKCAIAKMDKKPRIVLWNLARDMENYVSYEGMESVKDGLFFSPKFESGMCIFNCPHVFVFANFPPDESKLSADRWNVLEFQVEEGLPPLSALTARSTPQWENGEKVVEIGGGDVPREFIRQL